ncbi:MAG: glutathione S-transferase N-terminal domain-containing protein [Gammaproteobacteria bacterium]|nr:glutathione S-transferase N-terminal domain-containing protein [Gammaproteobacteria bacterium]
MKLYYSPTSPFVRKVNIVALETGQDKNIEWVKTNPWQAEAALTGENPLSKIPTLITDDGMAIYDSRVICEYLDSLHDKEKLIPLAGEARWQVLRLQVLADGMLDAGILRFMEKKRVSEQQSADWDSLQKNAIERGLNELEAHVAEWLDKVNLGSIAVACLLGWLDFRFSSEDWRQNRPALKQWFDAFSSRAAVIQTAPKE